MEDEIARLNNRIEELLMEKKESDNYRRYMDKKLKVVI